MNAAELRASLKAVCPRKNLFEAVQTVGHAVTGRNPLPILSHIKIHSEENGLRLTATDHELGMSCLVRNAEIIERGALAAPSRLLTEVLANLPDKDDVALSVDKSHTVRVHCEQSRSDYKILGLPAEDYPKLPEVGTEVGFSIPQSVFREMIRQTIFAVSTDETRAILTGIYMEFDGQTLRMVSTDTHRLAVRSTVVQDGKGSQNAIVPARAMNELAKELQDAPGDVRVSLASNQIRFALPGESEVEILSRLIEGQFPNYQRVIPSGFQKRLVIPVQALLRAVRRASIVARENSNRLIFRTDEDKLVLTADSQLVGNAREEVEITREGDDVEIAFNSKYLMDVLQVMDTYNLQMELSEPLKPGIVRPLTDPTNEGEEAETQEADYLCVLMPMQIL